MNIRNGVLLYIDEKDIVNGTLQIPEGVTYISCFFEKFSDKLKNVILPHSLEIIGRSAFSNCKNLKQISIPEKVTNIDEQAFSNCLSLESVKLPKQLDSISAYTFQNCENLKNVELPKNLKHIHSSAFKGCSNLKNINLPNTLTDIGTNAFSYSGLEKIEIPKNVQNIFHSAFFHCKSLKKVQIDSQITNLPNKIFSECSVLEEVKLPNTIEKFISYAFSGCENLKSINFPSKLKEIETFCFCNCKNLSSISLPSSLKIIEPSAFENCSKLRVLNLPNSVTTIGNFAFNNCTSLESLSLSESIKNLGKDIFNNCNHLTEVYFPDSIKFVKPNDYFDKALYFKKLPSGFVFSNNPQNAIPLYSLNINPAVLSRNWKNQDLLLKEQKNQEIARIYNNLSLFLSNDEFEKFITSHNFTFYKKFDLEKLKTVENFATFHKALYCLGAFSKPFEENGKVFDYSQKVSEFLMEKIRTKKASIESIAKSFEDIKNFGFKKEFTDFYLSNFDELVSIKKPSGFVAKCYNDFETVQKTNTSNKGNQRQLKPTVSKFVDYFKENKFFGITPKTKPIADTISPYFSNQHTFESAVNIFNEFQNNNIPSNILGFHLSEQKPFKNIDNQAKGIKALKSKILNLFINFANYEFSYDWLEKNDPENLILGKLCNCCTHLEGVGFGIMRASIIHPNIQNLVIRDNSNNIVAKSTLFVNDVQGYGVLNNFEVSESVSYAYHKDIYEKFVKGVSDFAKNYNKKHKKNPLKVITVGMGFNDLTLDIHKNGKMCYRPLKAIDYNDFSLDDFGIGHSGDSESQFIIWSIDEPSKEIEKS